MVTFVDSLLKSDYLINWSKMNLTVSTEIFLGKFQEINMKLDLRAAKEMPVLYIHLTL